MSFSLNKMLLIGNLGRDSETRFTNTNLAVTTFSIATENSYQKDNVWHNETTWHNIVCYSLSDFYKESLKKGAKVFVEGRLQKRTYRDKEGVERLSVNVVSERIIILNSPIDNNPPEDESEDQEEKDLPF